MQYKKYTVALLGPHDPIEYSSHQLESARLIGSHLARLGAVAVTGAVSGFPLWGALGAVEVGGVTLGFSPAGSKYEHENHFRQPLDYLSNIVYTGFGYLGRDIVMARSVDASVVFIGEEESSHEVFLTHELQKPIIVLRFDHPLPVVQKVLGNAFDHAEIYDTQEEVLARLEELIRN
jgi:predicted Rossmann-fold nucleotide-binding protein